MFALLGAPHASAAAIQSDIRDFGVHCDGSDERAAVQTAINSLPEGGTLNFSCSATVGPPGVSVRNKTGITLAGITGGGMKALVTNTTSARVVLGIYGCDSCVIRDLSVDSQFMPAIGIHINNSSNTTISNNTVQNVVWPAACALCTINDKGNRNNRYLHNVVAHTGRGPNGTFEGTRGIWIGQGNNVFEFSPDVEDNYVSDTGHTGIVVTGDAAIVRHNVIENLNTRVGCGIKLMLDPQNTSAPVYAEYNTIRGSTPGSNACGIQLEAGSASQTPVYIRYNQIEDVTSSGLYLGEPNYSVDNVYVTDNRLIDTGQQHPYSVTIYGKYGVSGGKLLFTRNQIMHDTSTGRHSGPVMLDGVDGNIGTSGVLIVGNTFSNGTTHGVQFLGGPQAIRDVTIEGNLFIGNGASAIQIDPTANIANISVAPDNCYAGNAGAAIEDRRGTMSSPAQSNSCK